MRDAFYQFVLAAMLQLSPDTTFAAGFEDAVVGLIDIRTFEGSWNNTQLNGNSGNTVISPAACRAAPAYVAGPNEFAIIRVGATGSSSATDVLYVFAGYSTNGGQSFTWSQFDMADRFNAVGHATSQLKVNLVAGQSYTFAAGVSSNGMALVNLGTCYGSVEILRILG